MPAGSLLPTLLVENSSGYHIAVRMNGDRSGTATQGRTCIPIPQLAGPIDLEFVALGMAPLLAWSVYLEESPHWQIQFRPGVTIKYDVLSLSPTDRSCRG